MLDNLMFSTPCWLSLSARRAWIEIARRWQMTQTKTVALRKESVDRNRLFVHNQIIFHQSLSARRAWIEILTTVLHWYHMRSLSARRAWIEMSKIIMLVLGLESLSARRAWIEIWARHTAGRRKWCRSPQGERG